MDLKQQIRDYVRRRGTELEQNLLERALMMNPTMPTRHADLANQSLFIL